MNRMTTSFMSRVPFAMVVILSLSLQPPVTAQTVGARPPASNASERCFAFQRDLDIWVSCDGKAERLTKDGRVVDYAIASDGSYLAYVQSPLHAAKYSEGWYLKSEVYLVPLGKNFEARRTSLPVISPSLFPSCGGVLLWTFNVPPTSQNLLSNKRVYYDLLSEKALSFPPYGNFRCNSDGTVVVGESDIVNNSGLTATLGIGSPKSRQIAQEAGFDFDVSANGKYIAYMNVELNLCVAALAGNPTCYSMEGKLDGISAADPFFVSDDGGVLFDELCLSDVKQSADCSSVGYWHPGQKADKVLERHAQKAQFISAETAATLHLWAALPHP